MTYPYHWFSEQVGLAGDFGSTNDVLIPLCMTRSLNKDLIQPFDEPERVFHSNLKLFKTLSLDYSSSSEFDLFSEYEDQSEGEVTKTMTKPTLREYREEVLADYGSNTTTPRFNKSAKFELGGDDEVLIDDVVSSDDEWKESNNKNHLNDNSDPFFKPYFDAQAGNNICMFEKGRECFDEHKPKIYGRNISELDDI
ncbi:hypothetical protein Tco_0256769 [Tanacetum coccineum]